MPSQSQPFILSCFYNEMKSTSSEPEGAGQADCALLKEVEKQ